MHNHSALKCIVQADDCRLQAEDPLLQAHNPRRHAFDDHRHADILACPTSVVYAVSWVALELAEAAHSGSRICGGVECLSSSTTTMLRHSMAQKLFKISA